MPICLKDAQKIDGMQVLISNNRAAFLRALGHWTA